VVQNLAVDQLAFNRIFDHRAVRSVAELTGRADDLEGFAATLWRQLSNLLGESDDRVDMSGWMSTGHRPSPFIHKPTLCMGWSNGASVTPAGWPSSIDGKRSSLVDPSATHALDGESATCVQEDLWRGICCLRPGINGLSGERGTMPQVDKDVQKSAAC
jgi:hypothetical protein